MFRCFSQSWQCQLSLQTISVLKACYLQIFWWKGNVLLFLFPSYIIKLSSENQNGVGTKLLPVIVELNSTLYCGWRFTRNCYFLCSSSIVYCHFFSTNELMRFVPTYLEHPFARRLRTLTHWLMLSRFVEVMLQLNFSQSFVMFICFFYLLQKHISVRWVTEAYIC